MTAPNIALINARVAARLSQDDLANRLGTSKRHVQRLEAGTVIAPRPPLARMLEAVLRVPIEELGFPAVPDGRGGYDVQDTAEPGRPSAPQAAPRGNHTGIWLSQYEYPSSGRGQTLAGQHFVTIVQHGDELDVRSIPGASSNPDSPLTMRLTVEGSIVTGTWREQTAPDGYYRGATYYGAIQLRIDPTGRRMRGKWVGFGSDDEINTGPWTLTFQEASTSKATIERYSRAPE
jgi:transcriptional regulator with XRE-family HTH domain